jgi:hypothetical protein
MRSKNAISTKHRARSRFLPAYPNFHSGGSAMPVGNKTVSLGMPDFQMNSPLFLSVGESLGTLETIGSPNRKMAPDRRPFALI